MGRTLAEKVWDAHVVRMADNEPDLLYIDLHLIHEVTSPQAFDGLRAANRGVRRPDLTIATEDHNVPTQDTTLEIKDPISRKQIETLRANCNVISELSLPLLEVICVRPGIWPNCRSSGVVTVPATVCASAPGNCAVTRTVGVSIFGKAATGNSS